jgi:Na+-transporting NADH:ubiquinone oxidoreductase subunit NqrF
MAKILIIILIVLGIIVVAVVGTGVFLLSDDVTIKVNNRSCGNLDIAKGSAALKLNFLPGINVPSQIAQGETAVIQLPRRFVQSVSINNGSVEVNAFNRSFTFGTASIDMQNSTWDGTALAGLIGKPIDVSGDHTLVAVCNK